MLVALVLLSVLLFSCSSSDAPKQAQEVRGDSSQNQQATTPPQGNTSNTSATPPTSQSTTPVAPAPSQTTAPTQQTVSPAPAPSQTTTPTQQTPSPAPAPSQTTAPTQQTAPAPSQPTATTTPSDPLTFTLVWDPVNDSTVRGYKVHFGTSSRQYDTHQDVGNVTSFVSHVSGGYTWYFAVSAYNAAGDSTLSQELATPSP